MYVPIYRQGSLSMQFFSQKFFTTHENLSLNKVTCRIVLGGIPVFLTRYGIDVAPVLM